MKPCLDYVQVEIEPQTERVRFAIPAALLLLLLLLHLLLLLLLLKHLLLLPLLKHLLIVLRLEGLDGAGAATVAAAVAGWPRSLGHVVRGVGGVGLLYGRLLPLGLVFGA